MLYSCSNDFLEDLSETNLPSNEVAGVEEYELDSISEEDKTNYLKGIKDLEAQGYIVYHMYNSPTMSEGEISDITSNSVSYGKQTRNFIGGGIDLGSYGGNSGGVFTYPLILNPGESWRKLRQIRVRCGTVIDAIQFYWINNWNTIITSGQHGGSGGIECWMILEPNEYIQKIEIRHGKYVDGLTFYVLDRVSSKRKVYTYGERNYGGAASTEIEIASDMQIQGFYGRSGKYLDRLGFYAYSQNLIPIV